MPFRALSDLFGLQISRRTIGVCQLVAYLVLVAVVVIGFVKIGQQNDELQRLGNTLCTATNANRAFIRQSLERSRKSLPTILYYREHPAELRRALHDVNQTLRDLPPDPCP